MIYAIAFIEGTRMDTYEVAANCLFYKSARNSWWSINVALFDCGSSPTNFSAIFSCSDRLILTWVAVVVHLKTKNKVKKQKFSTVAVLSKRKKFGKLQVSIATIWPRPWHPQKVVLVKSWTTFTRHMVPDLKCKRLYDLHQLAVSF